MLKKLWERIVSVLGFGVAIIFLPILTLSFPLSVIAIMHWFHLHEWFAGLIVIFFPPALIICTLPGLYFLYQADFNIDNAISGNYQSFVRGEKGSIPTNEKELQTMRAVLFPKMKQNCIKAFDGKENWTQLIVVDKEKFCYCYATRSLQAMTLQEINYQYKHKTSSKNYDDVVINISISCNSE